ncbi:MAG: putative nitrous-oxide reductase protein NosX [Pseudomonadota bacterium]
MGDTRAPAAGSPAAAGLSRRQALTGLLLTAGLQRAGPARAAWPPSAVLRQTRELMGTRVSLTVVAADTPQRQAALDAAWAGLAAGSAQLSRFTPDGPLQALARAAGQPRWIEVPPLVWRVLGQAQAVSQATDGAFDVTVGAYRDWDFRAGAPERLPAPSVLRAQRLWVDWRAVERHPQRPAARLHRPGMTLDLGGIAKLPLLEAALQTLRDHGVHDAMIDGGGDVLCQGSHAGAPWRVGVRDPRAPARLAAVLSLHDGVVASSGDYERGFVQAGRRYHHVLDPATGWPTRGVPGVALRAARVADVNGLGSAIMVGGPLRARAWLAARPQVQALIATPDGHWLTPGWPADPPGAGPRGSTG